MDERIKLAPPRRRPRRIAKKIARRFGAKRSADGMLLAVQICGDAYLARLAAIARTVVERQILPASSVRLFIDGRQVSGYATATDIVVGQPVAD